MSSARFWRRSPFKMSVLEFGPRTWLFTKAFPRTNLLVQTKCDIQTEHCRSQGNIERYKTRIMTHRQYEQTIALRFLLWKAVQSSLAHSCVPIVTVRERNQLKANWTRERRLFNGLSRPPFQMTNSKFSLHFNLN